MSISYSMPRFQAIDQYGRPMVGATLYTYKNKTTTPAPTWRDKDQTAHNTNPIVLDARGEAVIWLDPEQVYTFVLRDWYGALVWSQNDISGAVSQIDLSNPAGAKQVGFGGRSVFEKLSDVPEVSDFPGGVMEAVIAGATTVADEYSVPVCMSINNKLNMIGLINGQVSVEGESQGVIHSINQDRMDVQRVFFRQPQGSPITPGTGNDHSMLKFRGGEFGRAVLNDFQGQFAISFMLSTASSGDRRSKFNSAIGNRAFDLDGMFLETIGASYSSLVGNIGKSLNTSTQRQHGIRITGYTNISNSIDSPNIGTVGSANILFGFLSGVSIQNSAQLFDLTSTYIENCEQAVQVLNGTSSESDPRNGRVSFAARNCRQYISVGRCKNLSFEFVIDASANSGSISPIEELSHASPYGGNQYSGVIFGARTAAQTVLLRHPNAKLNLVLDDCTNGVTISATAHAASGDVILRNIAGAGLSIAANNCRLRITAIGVSGPYAVSVSGNGNSIELETDGRLVVGGSDNRVSGVVGGSITNSGTNNDLTGIRGYAGRGLIPAVFPDANGDVTINLGSHPNSPRAFQANAWGGNKNLTVFTRTVTAAGVAVVRVMDGASPYTGQCAISYSY